MILKKSSGTHLPERVVPADEPAAINRLEAKILADEQWLCEIKRKFNAGTGSEVPYPRMGSVKIFI